METGRDPPPRHPSQEVLAVEPPAAGKRGRGRPQGAATRITRMKANEIAQSGESPLDAMWENQRFWMRYGRVTGKRLAELLAGTKDDGQREELIGLLKSFLTARENAQQCARDLAPYVHPRLQSVAMKIDKADETEMIIDGMTVEQAADAYAKTLGK